MVICIIIIAKTDDLFVFSIKYIITIMIKKSSKKGGKICFILKKKRR